LFGAIAMLVSPSGDHLQAVVETPFA
jgi:hypothetical protein